MHQGKSERNKAKNRLCGRLTAADLDPFVRLGMTREEAHRAALKAKKKRKTT
jgi:hypothetical protein